MKKILTLFCTIALVFGSLLFAGCSNNGHAHTWAETYSHNETQHWKKCTDNTCTEKHNVTNHIFAEDTCSVCGYEKAIESGYEHSWAETYSYNETQHWKECTDNDCTEKHNVTNHIFAEDTCSTCGYEIETQQTIKSLTDYATVLVGYSQTIINWWNDGSPTTNINLDAYNFKADIVGNGMSGTNIYYNGIIQTVSTYETNTSYSYHLYKEKTVTSYAQDNEMWYKEILNNNPYFTFSIEYQLLSYETLFNEALYDKTETDLAHTYTPKSEVTLPHLSSIISEIKIYKDKLVLKEIDKNDSSIIYETTITIGGQFVEIPNNVLAAPERETTETVAGTYIYNVTDIDSNIIEVTLKLNKDNSVEITVGGNTGSGTYSVQDNEYSFDFQDFYITIIVADDAVSFVINEEFSNSASYVINGNTVTSTTPAGDFEYTFNSAPTKTMLAGLTLINAFVAIE